MSGQPKLFFAEGIPDAGTFIIRGDEVHHIRDVMRMQAGEKLRLTDGAGFFYDAGILHCSAKECAVEIHKKEASVSGRSWRLHLAFAPLKSSARNEILLEKACECGVDSLIPLHCHNGERRSWNAEKARRTLIAALKQAGRAHLPLLQPVIPFGTFISDFPDNAVQKLMPVCRAIENKKLLTETYLPGTDVLLLVGPEGDFTAEEIAIAVHNHCTPVSLGTHTLRSETAAIASCVMIHTLNGGKL